MKRFIEGADRRQATLLPEYLEDWVEEDNPVRVIDAFIDELDLGDLGFTGVDPKATGVKPPWAGPRFKRFYKWFLGLAGAYLELDAVGHDCTT